VAEPLNCQLTLLMVEWLLLLLLLLTRLLVWQQ
jgi:hypothetical protein